MNAQKTLAIIKPDAVNRGLVGEITRLYEIKGLKICQMKMLIAPESVLEAHYFEHIGKPFYENLISFMRSGPLVALVLEGPDAIKVVRKINGATDHLEAEYGTVRGLYALDLTQNCVHGSDSEENAMKEIAIWFDTI
jgi:nucleoside-diphosphate kinase